MTRIRNLAEAIDVCARLGIGHADFPLNHEIRMTSDGAIEVVDMSAEAGELLGRSLIGQVARNEASRGMW
jgi:hypothetical protein